MASVKPASLFQLVALLAVASVSVRVKLVSCVFLATYTNDLALGTIVHKSKPLTVFSKQPSL
jgi:hypothetical protein